MTEDKFNVKQSYEELKKKYTLPDFDKINHEFEIENIDKGAFLLRKIRRLLNEKIVFYCRIIENLIYPQQPNIITITESKVLTKEDSNVLEKLYAELMILERESLLFDVKAVSDKEEAEYILRLFKQWSNFKSKIEPIILKCKDTWSKKEVIEDKNHFFG